MQQTREVVDHRLNLNIAYKDSQKAFHLQSLQESAWRGKWEVGAVWLARAGLHWFSKDYPIAKKCLEHLTPKVATVLSVGLGVRRLHGVNEEIRGHARAVLREELLWHVRNWEAKERAIQLLPSDPGLKAMALALATEREAAVIEMMNRPYNELPDNYSQHIRVAQWFYFPSSEQAQCLIRWGDGIEDLSHARVESHCLAYMGKQRSILIEAAVAQHLLGRHGFVPADPECEEGKEPSYLGSAIVVAEAVLEAADGDTEALKEDPQSECRRLLIELWGESPESVLYLGQVVNLFKSGRWSGGASFSSSS